MPLLWPSLGSHTVSPLLHSVHPAVTKSCLSFRGAEVVSPEGEWQDSGTLWGLPWPFLENTISHMSLTLTHLSYLCLKVTSSKNSSLTCPTSRQVKGPVWLSEPLQGSWDNCFHYCPPTKAEAPWGRDSVLLTTVSREPSAMPKRHGCSSCIFCKKEGRNQGRAIVSVIPTVTISAHGVPSLQAAILTCHVHRFYPEVQITWLEKKECYKTCEALTPTKNPDGTFSQDSHILVNTSEDKRLFTCQVRREAQTLVQASMQLSKFREGHAHLGE